MNKVITKNQIRKNRILRTLLEEGRLSLTDVAKRTGISLPMVSRLAAALREEKLIITGEGGKIDRAGRPPIVAQLDGDAGYVLGFDLGHRNTNIVLINLEQHIVVERHLESPLLGNDPAIVAWLAARVVGCDVELVDVNPARARVAGRLGVAFATPDTARPDRDVVLHTSGSESGLRVALRLAGFEARIVELSWYGTREVTVPLGEGFHVRRLQLVSSQVGHIPEAQRSRWTHRRRLQFALSRLADPALDAVITGESAFVDLPDVMARLSRAPGHEICHRVRY